MFSTFLRQSLYLCIKFVAQDNCEFVAQHVTLQLKINIVLPDCMKCGGVGVCLQLLVRCVENLLELFILSFILHICCQLHRVRLQIAV